MITRRQFSISTAAFSAMPLGAVGLKADDFARTLQKKAQSKVQKRECVLFGGRKLSLLGFGSASGWCVNNRDEAITCLKCAIDSGINYFDTAYNYHSGKGEGFLSEGLRGLPRESYFLCDKMPTWLINSLDDAKRIFHEQLVRCGVTYFDNYMLHNMRNEEEYERVYVKYGVLDYLLEQKAKGVIRHLGFSFHGRVPLLEKLIADDKFEMVQLTLNALEWNGPNQAKTCCELCQKRGLPIFVMQPLSHGRLAHLKPEAEKILKEAAPNRSVASWSFRFVSGLPGVACVLSGPGALAHIQENVQTFSEETYAPLSADEDKVFWLAISVELSGKKLVPCTGCRYCMPCKYGVDIVGVFQWWNGWLRGGQLPTEKSPFAERRQFLRSYYNRFPVGRGGGGATYCIGCKKCQSACPQWQFVIPDELAKIDAHITVLRALDEDFRPYDRPQKLLDRALRKLKLGAFQMHS